MAWLGLCGCERAPENPYLDLVLGPGLYRGLRLEDGYLYTADIWKGRIYRIPLDLATGRRTGLPEVVTDSLLGLDAVEGGVLYAVNAADPKSVLRFRSGRLEARRFFENPDRLITEVAVQQGQLWALVADPIVGGYRYSLYRGSFEGGLRLYYVFNNESLRSPFRGTRPLFSLFLHPSRGPVIYNGNTGALIQLLGGRTDTTLAPEAGHRIAVLNSDGMRIAPPATAHNGVFIGDDFYYIGDFYERSGLIRYNLATQRAELLERADRLFSDLLGQEVPVQGLAAVVTPNGPVFFYLAYDLYRLAR
ncbi:MAG: hypothetical protein N2561_06160 [Bacteroidetes bacterium]|nr:hypothetical protein [Rhodothermia bacterium]MCS7154740.1 hypothetical protein [Bacteroidota bacterium]MCX7907103.1 hypothetical protein [Bacteroidota bacterium]MDW8137533.1 hypothetical protein [Bacteroidota bacterium]MDW8285513.1 hypothetical protein [Bacteroidota bacterium]